MTTRLRVALVIALLIAGIAGLGCAWVKLGYNSARYKTTGAGESANVAILGTTAYGTLADRGFEVVDLSRPERRRIVPPPSGSESIDDLAIADGLLFALDARKPGHLAVFSLADPHAPAPVSSPVPVDVGPFSGVSAGGGRVIVSGGTSPLSLRDYDRNGRLDSPLATIDLGRGQPDVLVAPDGARAFVSTHFRGPHFGLTMLDIGGHPSPLTKTGSVDLDTFGFTAGGAKPASFPIEAALTGDVVLVAHVKGLAVISVRDPRRPRLLSVLELPVKAVNVDVDGEMAAVVGSSPKPTIVLVDVSNPSVPKVRTSVALPEGSYATSVAIGRSHVAIAAHRKGMLVYRREGWSIRPERTSR